MKTACIKLGPADYLTTAWSGGTTTQLRIAPEGAQYAARDFLWRVSSAAVELAESDFTPLPDYERLIATLRGEIALSHNGGAPLRLRPYEVHAFSGGDRTRCRGTCTDFNLMLRRGRAEGTMEALRLSAGETRRLDTAGADEALLFAAEGRCAVSVGAESVALSPGESLLLRGPTAPALTAETDAALMLCRMRRL